MVPWGRKWQPTPVFLPGESHGGARQATVHGATRVGLDSVNNHHHHHKNIVTWPWPDLKNKNSDPRSNQATPSAFLEKHFAESFLGAQLFLFVCLFSLCGPAVRLSLLTVLEAQTCDQYQDDILINNIICFYSQCVRFVPPHLEMFTISYTWGQNIFIHINYFHNQRGMYEPEIQFSI